MENIESGSDPYNKSSRPHKKPLEQVSIDVTKDYLSEIKAERDRLELLKKLEEEEQERRKKHDKKY